MNSQLVSRFTRRVAFGMAGDKLLPTDPVAWAADQLSQLPPIDIMEAGGERRKDLPKDMRLLSEMDEVMRAFALHQSSERKSFERAGALTAGEYEAFRERTVFTPFMRLQHWKEVQARESTALHGESPVFERFWHFWANHFMVAPGNQNNDTLVGPYQRSLRPLMLGNFREMLWHAVTHPGMLVYLDNNRNTGPNSKAARQKWTKDSINENLGRELLELFTVSPKAGYTQKDVGGVTLILTGWRDMKPDQWHRGQALGTFFDFDRHEPGSQEVLGKTYTAFFKPSAKLEDLVTDLAHHPATAQHIATKLCVYFIDDAPPAEAVASVRNAFIQSQGDLPTVHRAVVEASWKYMGTTRKFVSPETWLLQVLTVTGGELPRTIPFDKNTPGIKTPHLLGDLGQELPRCPQPNGWPIRSSDWMSKELLDRRLRILGVLVDMARRAGKAGEAQARMISGVRRDLEEDSLAARLLARSEGPTDMKLSWITYFASPTMLWS